VVKGNRPIKRGYQSPSCYPVKRPAPAVEPGKSLYAQIPSVLTPGDDRVIDAAIWMSYPWADEPRNHGVVMAYGDDQEAVGKAAEALAQHFWKVREQFEFVAPTTYLDDALEQALGSDKKPFIISDDGG